MYITIRQRKLDFRPQRNKIILFFDPELKIRICFVVAPSCVTLTVQSHGRSWSCISEEGCLENRQLEFAGLD